MGMVRWCDEIVAMDLIYDFAQAGPGDSMFALGSIADVAGALERSGWYALSFTEHPAPPARWLTGGGHQSIDPFVALGSAAATTERLRLLTYLAVAPYRNPLMLAQAAATVDLVSNGRLILGLGTGYLKGEFRAVGADFDTRNRRFDEMLDVLPLYFSGEPFDYEGSDFVARDIQALPAPVQSPVPLWIGGNARITRERVATRAHGWMPLLGSPDVMTVTRTPALAGIDDVAAKISSIVDQASERTDGFDPRDLEFVYLYSDSAIWTATGPEVEHHREAIAAIGEAGATKLVVNVPPAADRAHHLDLIESVGASYGSTSS